MTGVVVGVGVASAATAAEVAALVASALTEAGLRREDVVAVATVAARRDHPAIRALGLPVVAFRPEELGARPAVAEPAARRAAGAGAVLLVPKRRSARATVAIARGASGGRADS